MLTTPWLIAAALAAPPSTTPSAQPDSAARQCADAATGSEIDICLRVAASNPDQLDGVAIALRGHINRSAGVEREFLTAILQLMSPESAVEGARALGALPDSRAVAPLVEAARYREEVVALEAVAALGRHPEALEALAHMLEDRALDTPIRVAAVRALGDLGGDEAADALLGTLRRSRVPSALRGPIIDTITHEVSATHEKLEHPVTKDGRWWVAIGGAYSLGYGLESAGYFGQTPGLAPIGAVSGVAAGGTAGLLMGRAWPIEAGQAAFVTSSGVGASLGGTIIGGSFGDSQSSQTAARIGGLTGGVVGFGTAIALRKRHEAEPVDASEAWGIAISTGVIAATAVDIAAAPDTETWRPRQFAAGTGTIVGLVVGEAVAPRITLSKRDTLMIGVLGTYGSVAGALVPVDRMGTLPAAGFVSGAMTGYLIAPRFEPGPDVSVGALAGIVYGGTLGAGVGITARANSRATKSIALLGATGGMGLGGYAAWKNSSPFDLSDGVIVGLATGWAGWQAVGWSNIAKAPTAGPVLVALSGAGIGTLLLTPYLDVPATASFAAVSLGIWGGYIGGVSAYFLDRPYNSGLAFALVGSDVGLVLGGFAMSPIVNAHPLIIGLGDAGGVLGGSLTLLGASFATNDPDVLLGASLGGAAAGFIGGALIGNEIARSSKDIALGPIEIPGRWSVVPGVVTDGYVRGNGLVLTVDRW